MQRALPVAFSLFLQVAYGSDILPGWWKEHAEPWRWQEWREQVGEKIQAQVDPTRKDLLNPGGDLEQWFRLWQWLKLTEEPNYDDRRKLLAELGTDPEILRSFLENLRPEDSLRGSMAILCQMQSDHPEDVRFLPRLAVALALVFDQPIPQGWPHGQVRRGAIPMEKPDPVRRLHSMVLLQKDRRYLLDLRDLMVDELKYLVDHPLDDSELDWARKNVTASRSGFGKVFSSVRYDIPRYERNILTWPYPSYALAEIRQKGGICVDQAYYAAMSGKAKGLPTLFFTGQGDSGGHAWFGYLESPGRWETDCGRYEQENYPVGEAMDPQVWKPISDTELTFLAKNRERSPNYRQARLWTDYASSLGKGAVDGWIQAALTIQPEYLPAWSLKAELMDQTNAPLTEKKAFWENFTKRFSPYADLKVQGQQKLLELAKASGDAKGASSLERQILVQNRTRRFDLGIGAAAGQMGEKIQAGDWDGAMVSFRAALREYKGQVGGHLFYGLVLPFVEAAIAEGQFQVAKNALAEARRIFKPTQETLVGRSFILLEGKIAEGDRKK
ncbi:MAG: hypothetical protein EB090_02010 [Verrucomicrobia bacterium]|nr:hypothetical protein [Verrucomicrobiota bacterium]